MSKQIEWQNIQMFDEDLELDEELRRHIFGRWLLWWKVNFGNIANIWNEELLLMIEEAIENMELYDQFWQDGYEDPNEYYPDYFHFLDPYNNIMGELILQWQRLNSDNPDDILRRCVASGIGI